MLHCETTEKTLSITEDSAPILTYTYGDRERPAHFHPLYAPNGQGVTDNTRIGHQHPPGLCFSLGTESLAQPVLTRQYVSSAADPTAKFTIVTTWGAKEPLLIETCTTEVHPPQTEVQVLDIAISLQARTTSLEFAGNVGLSCLTTDMEYRKALDADGRIGESEVSGNVSAWGTISGITTAEQTAVGVAIFPHPMNRDTKFFAEDISFGFLFAQASPFTVGAETTRTLKYRVLAYIGDLFTFDIWQFYQDYL